MAGLEHLQLDLTEPGAVERSVEETVGRLGSLDILVNNVGAGRLWSGFADERDSHWAESFELNLMTAIRTTPTIAAVATVSPASTRGPALLGR